MRNEENWRPTKYEVHAGRVRASRDVAHLSVASRLITDLVGEVYTLLIPKYCRGDLLDVGCGHAPFYKTYRDSVDTVTCMDWAESLHQNQFLDYCHDLNKPFPLEDNRFDTVICSDVLEHISEPKHVWREVHRVLKPGGTLLLNVPFFYLIHEEPHDFHRYTAFALRHYAESSGFQVVELSSVGGIKQVAADVLGKLVRGVPAGELLSRCIQKIGNPNSQRTVQRSLKRDGVNRWPLLYFIVARKAPSS